MTEEKQLSPRKRVAAILEELNAFTGQAWTVHQGLGDSLWEIRRAGVPRATEASLARVADMLRGVLMTMPENTAS